jgi:uncharacterized protein YlzI (FlbEa/FlbD family)
MKRLALILALILLTRTDGSPLYIAAEQVIAISPAPTVAVHQTAQSAVTVTGMTFYVREAPAEIVKKIAGAR